MWYLDGYKSQKQRIESKLGKKNEKNEKKHKKQKIFIF